MLENIVVPTSAHLFPLMNADPKFPQNDFSASAEFQAIGISLRSWNFDLAGLQLGRMGWRPRERDFASLNLRLQLPRFTDIRVYLPFIVSQTETANRFLVVTRLVGA